MSGDREGIEPAGGRFDTGAFASRRDFSAADVQLPHPQAVNVRVGDFAGAPRGLLIACGAVEGKEPFGQSMSAKHGAHGVFS